ncbi:hypothetical protein KAR91_57250 [Candidatus Pacearchaeota archaeon]|nr:hypothetical protein [Candidatus Pacearchaeota archaeon]
MKPEIIEELRNDNWIVFCKLSQESCDAANDIGIKWFEMMDMSGKWIKPSTSNPFYDGIVYRLRPDYEQYKCDMCSDRGLIESTLPHDKAYYGDERPCPSCKPESEIVECEIFVGEGVLRFNHGHEKRNIRISDAINHPDFIGFKFEGQLWGMLYKNKANGNHQLIIDVDLIDEYEVCGMAGADVLFRKSNG